ncbi:MAG TPA: DUF541 domain-containing protein [candidate division Zixibacteria bacterium]|nr:DUF541 domain-containing protein [candidate division Zixibacteria bacterium]
MDGFKWRCRMNKLVSVVFSLVVLMGPGVLADSEVGRYILVSGEGEVVAEADQISFSFEIETRDKDLEAAKKVNDEKLEKVKEIFKLFTIASEDIKVSSFKVYPHYDYEDGKIKRFEISREVEVTLREINKYEPLIDALIEAEVYDIGGLSYELSNSAELNKLARENALDQARNKAREMAEYYGMKLGEVIYISEGSSPSFFNSFGFGASQARVNTLTMPSDSPMILKGRKTIKASIIVKFELID